MAKDTARFNTPRGTSYFSAFVDPSTYQGKPTNKFEVNLILEGDALEAMKKIVQDFVADNVPPKAAKTLKMPFRETKDGKVFAKFWTNTISKAKDGSERPRSVPIKDSKGNPVSANIGRQVGNGSVLVVAASIGLGTKENVNLYLEGVQIIKFVNYNPNEPRFAVVDDEEGGFDATADEFAEPENTSAPDEFSKEGSSTSEEKTPDF